MMRSATAPRSWASPTPRLSGATEAATFGAAIEAAKGDLRAAFEIRQQLDDATPEDRPSTPRMLGDLISRCHSARARLDAETERFEELRAFEREAPGILAALPATIDAVEEAVSRRWRPP